MVTYTTPAVTFTTARPGYFTGLILPRFYHYACLRFYRYAILPFFPFLRYGGGWWFGSSPHLPACAVPPVPLVRSVRFTYHHRLLPHAICRCVDSDLIFARTAVTVLPVPTTTVYHRWLFAHRTCTPAVMILPRRLVPACCSYRRFTRTHVLVYPTTTAALPSRRITLPTVAVPFCLRLIPQFSPQFSRVRFPFCLPEETLLFCTGSACYLLVTQFCVTCRACTGFCLPACTHTTVFLPVRYFTEISPRLLCTFYIHHVDSTTLRLPRTVYGSATCGRDDTAWTIYGFAYVTGSLLCLYRLLLGAYGAAATVHFG